MNVQLCQVSDSTVTVNFPNGSCRPATALEIELIHELERLSA